MSFFPNLAEEVSDVESLAVFVNVITGNLFGYGTLFVIWAVFVMAFLYFRKTFAIAAASYITFIISVLFWVGGLTDSFAVMILLTVSIGSTMMTWFK